MPADLLYALLRIIKEVGMPTNNALLKLLGPVILLSIIIGVPTITRSRSAQNKDSTNGEKSSLMYAFSSALNVWNFVGDASDLKGLTEMPAEELIPFLNTVFIAFIGFCLIKKLIASYMQKQVTGIFNLKANVKLLAA